MTNTERETLQAQLAEIDRARAKLEVMLSTMPHTPCCCEHGTEREQLELEMTRLWGIRAEVARQLA